MTPPRDVLELCPSCVELLDIPHTLAVGYPGVAAVPCDECRSMVEPRDIVTVARRAVRQAKEKAETCARKAHGG